MFEPPHASIRQWICRDGFIQWSLGQKHYDIAHCFNHIPVTSKPWLITFEDILPRTWGLGSSLLRKLARSRLLGENCAHLIGLSEYSRRKIAEANCGWERLPELMGKVTIIPPTVPTRNFNPKQFRGPEIELAFIGRTFARKGGVTALRLAKKAHEMNLPLKLYIASSLRVDAYTDHSDPTKYKDDFALLDLPNVELLGEIPNSEVLELLRRCDFQYMPTLADTFGYSIIEGFSVGTPALVTGTCALPEIVQNQVNGFILNVDVNEQGDVRWLRDSRDRSYRGTDEYWELLDQTYSDLADQSCHTLSGFLEKPTFYEALSEACLHSVETRYNAVKTSKQLDRMYRNMMTIG